MNKMKEMLEQIVAEATQKKMKFLATDLLRKFDSTSDNDLDNLCRLCYWLYINGKEEDCFSLCSKVVSESKNGEIFYKWSRELCALYARLLRKEGKNEEAQQCMEKVIAKYKPKTLQRFLNGNLLYDDKIDACLKEGDENYANIWRFSQLTRLCAMRELGGSETYPIERLDKEMDEIKQILHTINDSPTPRSTDPDGDSIEQYWKRIENWLKSNAPEIGKALNIGATELELQNLETAVNAKLPDDFKTSCLIHNGQLSETTGLIAREELLSVERIQDEWKIWKGLIDSNDFEDIQSSPDKEIKNDWYNPLWIPITYDGCGNHFCLDLAPTQEGQYGQVIRVWHDDANRTLIASSFKEWLQYFTEDLENGRYSS